MNSETILSYLHGCQRPISSYCQRPILEVPKHHLTIEALPFHATAPTTTLPKPQYPVSLWWAITASRRCAFVHACGRRMVTRLARQKYV